MSKFSFNPVILVGISLLFFSGCELFEDSDKCQSETTESRIWLPGRDIAYSPRDSSVTFCFNRSGVLSERSYQIDNVCPLGALGFKVDIIEGGSIFAPRPLRYRVLLVERTPNTSIYKIRRVTAAYRQSDNMLKAEGILDLIGLPEEGPRYFFIGVAAIFEPGTFPTLIDLETWAQENITQVTFTASFVKYE